MFDIDKAINNIKEYAELLDKYRVLEEENKKLKESLDIATKCSSKEEDGIIRLSEENRKLEENIAWYEKEEDRLRKEIKRLKGEIKELETWLREKLPLALLKEYMDKFEGVDLKNV